VGSRFFSFLPTKDHFSSNWTSRVRGGEGDQFVVEVAGVLAGDLAQTADGAAVHLAESAGLADAAPLGDVLQDRLELLRRQSGIEERRPLAFGEAGLASVASEHAPGLLGPIAAGDGQISGPPLAMLGAVAIQAAEAREVVHGAAPSMRSSLPKGGCVTPIGIHGRRENVQ
jgi:hypothetical protein